MTMVVFDITDLKEGNVRQAMATPSADELDLDSETFSDIEVEVILQKSKETIDVSFDARATASLQGDRTLRWYDESISGSFGITFKPVEQFTEADEDDESVRPFSPTDTELDLTQEIRDTLMLALPLRRIAPGGEEEELQLEYGTPKDSDDDSHLPEWKQKLQDLHDEDDTE